MLRALSFKCFLSLSLHLKCFQYKRPPSLSPFIVFTLDIPSPSSPSTSLIFSLLQYIICVVVLATILIYVDIDTCIVWLKKRLIYRFVLLIDSLLLCLEQLVLLSLKERLNVFRQLRVFLLLLLQLVKYSHCPLRIFRLRLRVKLLNVKMNFLLQA